MIQKLFACLIAGLLAVAPVQAQTPIPIPAPQTTPITQYVTGWDETGFITSAPVDFSSLTFKGLLYGITNSNTSASMSPPGGNIVLYLNNTAGFAVDYTVQVFSNDDPQAYFYGIITALDTSTGAATIASTIVPAEGTFQNWTVQVVAGPSFGLPASSASGVIADTFSVPSQGGTVTTTTDTGKFYLPGASVYVASIADYTAAFVATVVSYNTSTGAIVLFANQVSGSGSNSVWTISMVDTAGAAVTTVSYSSTSLQFGSAHDIDVGKTVSVTTGTGKLFTPGSHVILNSTTDSTQYFRGISQSYNTATGALSLFVTDVGAAATGTYAAWSVYAQDGPSPQNLITTYSTTSVNLSTIVEADTVNLATTFFPLNGLVSSAATAFVYSAANSSNAFLLTITSVGPLNLQGKVTGVAGSGSHTDWVIVLQVLPLGSSNQGILAWFSEADFVNVGAGGNGQNLRTYMSTAASPGVASFVYAPTGTNSNPILTFAWGGNYTLTVTGSATISGSPVMTTGSPASGNLTKFSGTNSITNGDLSGDVTTTSTLATTLATVNGNVGSFGSSTAIPNFTVNGKGLITAAGTNVVIAPAGTLTGATLAANVLASSLTSLGTIATGTWQGTKVALAYGGTNADLSATGGTSQFLKQATAGAAITVAQPAFSDLSGSVTCAQLPALTGDVTSSAGACATTVVNLPTGTTMAGQVVAGNIAAPSSPAAAHVAVWADSTALRLHDKNASGVIGTTVVADTGASNNFLTAVSASGVISKAQPAFSDLSGSAACAQLPALTGDVTTSAGACATAIGATKVTSAMLNADVFSTAHSWAGQQTFVAPILGTPASGVATNLTGTASGLTAGSVTTNANLTGDVTSVGNATTLANIPTSTPAAGTILHTNVAAPSSPAAGKVQVYSDSTDLRLHDKNASGAIGTTVVADTGATNNFLTAISAAGAVSKAQPAFSNLSGSATCAQLPALTGDVTSSAGACATTVVNLPTGTTAAGTILHSNVAAPSSPASGKVQAYTDSTDLRFHDKNASGVIGTTVVADTGAASNFITAISTAGAISKAQPAFTDISGALASGQFGPLTGDVTTSGYAATVAKINGVTLGSTTATAGNLLIGSGTTWVTNAMSGDITINSTGVTAIGAAKVTNAMLAGSIAASKLIGSDITTVGTIGTGIWQGTAVAATYGGTGIDSHSSTGVAQVASGTWSVSTALASGTTATRQAAGDNSTKVATTSYVDSLVALASGTFPTSSASQTVSSITGNTVVITWSAMKSATTVRAPQIQINASSTAGDYGGFVVSASGAVTSVASILSNTTQTSAQTSTGYCLIINAQTTAPTYDCFEKAISSATYTQLTHGVFNAAVTSIVYLWSSAANFAAASPGTYAVTQR